MLVLMLRRDLARLRAAMKEHDIVTAAKYSRKIRSNLRMQEILKKMRIPAIFLIIAIAVGFALGDVIATPVQITSGVVATKAYYRAWFDIVKRCYLTVSTPMGTASTQYDKDCSDVPFTEGQHLTLKVSSGRITKTLFALLPTDGRSP
jgi:hypothetical protein